MFAYRLKGLKMYSYQVNEPSIQSMVDEYLNEEAENLEPELTLHCGADDFKTLGYVVYWIEEDKYLTPYIDNDSCLFHGLATWAKTYASKADARGVAMLLSNSGRTLNSGFRVLKAITNEGAVKAANNLMKTTAVKKKKFTGVDDSYKYLILLSPVWSNFPFSDSLEVAFEDA